VNHITSGDGGRVRAFFADPPRPVARTVRVLTAVEIGLGVAAMLIIFVLVLAQALQRYLPVEGWPWTGELARFSLVWLTFVTAGVLVSRDSHIAIESIDAVRNPLVRRVVRVVACLTVAAVGALLTAEAWALVQSQGVLRSPAMGMPMSWFYGISIVGFVSTTLRAAVAALGFAVLGAPDPSEPDPAQHEAAGA
jgi:TRAP-type C4-dicarboxylate transport system permease small subunit